MEQQVYKIRPHHGLCLCFFQGKGYSSAFVENMTDIQQKLKENPLVCMISRADAICRKCPNNAAGTCTAEEKVTEYDRQVMLQCGISEGQIMPFLQFEKRIYRNILLPGKREDICGDCQWNALCRRQPSEL